MKNFAVRLPSSKPKIPNRNAAKVMAVVAKAMLISTKAKDMPIVRASMLVASDRSTMLVNPRSVIFFCSVFFPKDSQINFAPKMQRMAQAMIEPRSWIQCFARVPEKNPSRVMPPWKKPKDKARTKALNRGTPERPSPIEVATAKQSMASITAIRITER